VGKRNQTDARRLSSKDALV